jgi:hypothetical protein
VRRIFEIATFLMVATGLSDVRSDQTPIAAPPADPTQKAPLADRTSLTPTTTQHEVSAEDLVTLIAQRKLWPLSVEAAEATLRPLGAMKRQQPVPEALTLIGGRSGIVERFEISYSSDGKKDWIFVGASFFLNDRNLSDLRQRLDVLLQEQLGRPKWAKGKKAGEAAAAGWKLRGRTELTLQKSPYEGEQLLVIMISEPQRGAD